MLALASVWPIMLGGMVLIKYFVFPYNSISNTTVDKSDHINHVEKEIEIATKEITWYRFDGFSDKKEAYYSEADTVRYSSDVLLKTERLARPVGKRSRTVYEVDGIEVYAVLDNNVFAYAKDGKAYSYRAKDLPTAEPDNVLIFALEKMILEEPYWEEFENISRYLLKYDSDFITPVLERYAAGQFYDSETYANPSIMPEYIQNISERLLRQ